MFEQKFDVFLRGIDVKRVGGGVQINRPAGTDAVATLATVFFFRLFLRSEIFDRRFMRVPSLTSP